MISEIRHKRIAFESLRLRKAKMENITPQLEYVYMYAHSHIRVLAPTTSLIKKYSKSQLRENDVWDFVKHYDDICTTPKKYCSGQYSI